MCVCVCRFLAFCKDAYAKLRFIRINANKIMDFGCIYGFICNVRTSYMSSIY